MTKQYLRVEHKDGYDLVESDGAVDFDGGSLIVWRDITRSHMTGAYSPGCWLRAFWTDEQPKATHGNPL